MFRFYFAHKFEFFFIFTFPVVCVFRNESSATHTPPGRHLSDLTGIAKCATGAVTLPQRCKKNPSKWTNSDPNHSRRAPAQRRRNWQPVPRAQLPAAPTPEPYQNLTIRSQQHPRIQASICSFTIRTIRIVSVARQRPLQWRTIHRWNGKISPLAQCVHQGQ